MWQFLTPMISPTSSIGVIWLAWLIGWLIAARSTAKTVRRETDPSRLAHLLFILAGSTLLFFARGDPSSVLHYPLLPHTAWIGWGGAVLVVLGPGFTAWARVHLGRFWSGGVALKAEHALIRTGPYAKTRHPIYTGLLLALAGTALVHATVGALAGATLIAIGLIIRSHREERLLTEHFGDAYRAYRAEVPAMIPRLTVRKPLRGDERS